MKLIVGLGNPTPEYKLSRHNLGYMVVDEVAKTLNASDLKSSAKFFGAITELRYGSEKIILLKPTTYMNNSGKAVGAIAKFYQIDQSDIWVVYDELALNFGQLRVRRGGSSAGHNGIKSIIDAIGEDFIRFRAGIRNDIAANVTAEKFVLDNFSASERPLLPSLCEQISTIIIKHLSLGGQKAPVHESYDLLPKKSD